MQPKIDMSDCVFCKILTGTAPSTMLYSDEDLIVIHDIHPIAQVHLLVIPRKHISSLNELQPEDAQLASHLLLTVPRIARQVMGPEASFRTIINTGTDAGQSVFHLHIHIISGRPNFSRLVTRGLH